MLLRSRQLTTLSSLGTAWLAYATVPVVEVQRNSCIPYHFVLSRVDRGVGGRGAECGRFFQSPTVSHSVPSGRTLRSGRVPDPKKGGPGTCCLDQGQLSDREHGHRGVVHNGISSRAARGRLAGDVGDVARLCDPAFRFLPAESDDDAADEADGGECSFGSPISDFGEFRIIRSSSEHSDTPQSSRCGFLVVLGEATKEAYA
jgi:hypothetical protein